MEKIITGVIEKQLKDNVVIDYSQHRFTRGRFFLISFYDKVTFASVFTVKSSIHTAQAPEGKDRDRENDEPSTVGKDQV